jgi:hypothetical protein
MEERTRAMGPEPSASGPGGGRRQVVGMALRRALLPFGFVAGARPAKVRGVGVGVRRTGTRRERTWTGRDGKSLLRHCCKSLMMGICALLYLYRASCTRRVRSDSSGVLGPVRPYSSPKIYMSIYILSNKSICLCKKYSPKCSSIGPKS